MHQILTRMLVACAVIAAFAVAIHAMLRILMGGSTYMIMCDITQSEVPPVFKHVSLEDGCYPFRWQAKQREHLRQLLATPTTPPSETGSLGLARYAEYARHLRPEDPGYEQAMREGMRRDPQNALYHYLLAYRDLNRALEGPPPTKDAAGQPVYHYTVKDRELLDRAMSELAAGLPLPYHSRRYELVTARLQAMPAQRHWEDQLREAIVISPVPFHLYPEFNKFVQVNGFYLSQLLSKGKRRAARPYLQTGERLALQLAGDEAPSIKSMLVAEDALWNCARRDAAICRRYGMTTEAAEIERRNGLLSREARARSISLLKSQQKDAYEARLDRYAGILACSMAPGIGDEPSVPTSAMRIAGRVELTAIEAFHAALLPMLFIELMLYSALKYLRWRWAAIGYEIPRHDVRLATMDWIRILLVGFLLPVLVFAVYRSIPAFTDGLHIKTGIPLLSAGITAIMLWMLVVPTTIAANAVWRKSMAAGAIEVQRPVVGAVIRGASAVVSLAWAWYAARYFLAHPAFSLVGWLAAPPMTTLLGILHNPWFFYVILAVALIAVAFLPVLWEHRHPDCAAHFLALSRVMIPVYAVLALCASMLYLGLLAREQQYLRRDTMFTAMRSGGTLAFTKAEGHLVIDLQQKMLEGAKQLEHEAPDQGR